jgi:mannose/cellobiose epimerase-like protein (N-acyl-D-glucosamine 2-epimerase family)
MPGRLTPAAAALLGWATDAALPLWATAGFDAEHGRFEERLTLRAERMPAVPVRLLSQARQIYAYSLAARRGWYAGAADLVELAYASMVRDFRGRDGQDGWIFSIRRDGGVADPRRDFYAHTFVLLAIASYVEATGKQQALALADDTLAFLDRHLRVAAGEGFLEGLPLSDGLRRQNPHMHMFEGLLSLWECSQETRYLRRAEELFDLFATRFFRAEPGVLGEYFTAALQPAEGVAGRIVEPGHHYEWIWLLRRFGQITGRPVQPYVDALYGFADRHGFDGAGLIVDELLVDGSHHAPSRRIWPVAEAVKANLVEARLGRPGAAGKAASLAALLKDHFLIADPPGGWHDRLDRDGACLSRFMPASTLYHIVCAIDELSRFATPSPDPSA